MRAINEASPEILKELYWRREMSSPEIARKFGCSSCFVRNKLKEYGIPVKSLQEALSLSNKPRYLQEDFNKNLEEKAYLIGFSKGDLHVYSASDNSSTIFIQTNSTKPELIQIVEQLFSPYGHIWKSKPAKNRAICIRCSLNRSFNFLLNKKDLIESWILKNKQYFIAFLAGYADADGVFNLRSQDKNILHQIRTKLIELGILCRPPRIARKKGTRDIRGIISNEDIWGLWIYCKDTLLKLINLLDPYLKHAEKRKNMEIVKNNVLERNKKYNNQQDRKYYKLYLEEGVKI